jgi:hypothetical protein
MLPSKFWVLSSKTAAFAFCKASDSMAFWKLEKALGIVSALKRRTIIAQEEYCLHRKCGIMIVGLKLWKNLWSDECSAERGKGKMGKWVFCTPAQKWDPEMVQTYKKSKDLSVMVWRCC